MVVVAPGGGGLLGLHHEVLVTPGALLTILVLKQLQRAEGRVQVGVLPGPGPRVRMTTNLIINSCMMCVCVSVCLSVCQRPLVTKC